MNVMIGTFLIAAMGLATACERFENDGSTDICEGVDTKHVCALPFEAVYSYRQVLVDRDIRLDGALVIGIRPEPPGSQTPVMLLFPSMERARICNPAFAIELLTTSDEIVNELREANGGFVSVAGRLQPSSRGHWSQLDVAVSPISLSSERWDLNCMSVLPPMLPEPSSEED